MSNNLYRTIQIATRGIDEKTREATFVASTENPVHTPWGPEVLRMRGADLSRYESNPIFLDSHNGSSVENVLGSARQVSIEGRELVVRVRFAETDKGERAWKLVRDGHVRAVSIGYRVDPASVRRLTMGETDGEGPAQVHGPALIVNQWELLEVSLVPVPADKDATLRRSVYGGTMSTQAQTETPAEDFGPGPTLSNPGVTTSPYSAAVAMRSAPATPPAATAPAATPPAATAPAAPAATAPAAPAAPAATPTISAPTEDPEEVRARRIRALAPSGLRDLADRLVLEGKSVDEARAAFLAALTDGSSPVGTPETPAPQQRTNNQWPADVTNDVLLRSLKRNF